MSYPKQVLRLRPTSGIATDPPDSEVGDDFYTNGNNVLFRDSFAQRIGGNRNCYTQNDVNPVYHLLNVRAPGGITESNFWLVFGTASIKALETVNITAITGAALTAVSSPWQWASTLLNNIPCFTNGLDTPRYWAGDVGTPTANLPGWPAGTIAKSIYAFKFHLFALDIDGPSGHFESQILWSDAAAPGNVPSTWTASATNQAGSAILADTPGPCMCAASLQDTLLVFKRSSTYGINFVGGSSVFSVRLLDGVHGALTRHAAVDVGGKIFVVSDGDIFLTDGTNWQSIATLRIRDRLFSQLEQSSYENLYCVYSRAKSEVWVCYPTTGNTYCDEALVYNVATDSWGIRSLTSGTCAEVGVVNDTATSEAWDSHAEIWDTKLSAWNSANFSLATEQLISAHNSAVLTLEDDATLTNVAAFISKNDMHMGVPERQKFVKRVHIRTNNDPGDLTVRIGARDSVTASISYFVDQVLSTPNPFIDCLVLGKFISIEIDSSANKVWQIAGIDLEYELRGYV